MKIAVLISGGVDSSVALRLLKDQGHEITAFYLKIWLEDELSFLGDCPWEEDLAYVRAVCEQANVPLEIVNLQQEYHDRIVAYTIEEIKQGRTPNPDILCNKHIKFGAFMDYLFSADSTLSPRPDTESQRLKMAGASANYDYIASGHYAQISHTETGPILSQAPDLVKDQTYFLARMSKDQLQKALFPIGHLNKSQVRELAHKYNLPNKDRKDSQGICFLGKIKFSDFIKHHLGEQPGDLIEFETGNKLGTHPGFYFYTLGQRQGLGLAGGPWYVVKKDAATNQVFISRHYYDADKVRDSFNVSGMHWLAERFKTTELGERLNLAVKLRHGPKKYTCILNKVDDTVYSVQLQESDQGIAPGQFAVFYDGDHCVGSAMIIE